MLVGLNGVFGTLAGILSPVLAGWVIDVSGQYEYALYLGASPFWAHCSCLSPELNPLKRKVQTGICATRVDLQDDRAFPK
jgi:hypothetical protein